MISDSTFPEKYEAFTIAEKVDWLRRGLRRWSSAQYDVEKASAFSGLELRHDEELANQLWLDFAAPTAAWAADFPVSVRLALAEWSSGAGGVETFALLAALAGKCACPNLAESIQQLGMEPCIGWASASQLVSLVSECSQAIADHRELGFDDRYIQAAMRLREAPFKDFWRPNNALGLIERLALTSSNGVFAAFSQFSSDFGSVAARQPLLASKLIQAIFSQATPTQLRASIKSFDRGDLWVIPYLTGMPYNQEVPSQAANWERPIRGRFLTDTTFLFDWDSPEHDAESKLNIREQENQILFSSLRRHFGESYPTNVTSIEDAMGRLRGK